MHKLAVASLILGAAIVLTGCAPQQFLTLDGLVADNDPGITGLTEATESVCAGLAGCVEGYESDQANFLRFDSTDAANTFAARLGKDGFRSNFLVINWTGDISADHRQWEEEKFASAHQSR